jgi:hypothetical protein
MLQVQWGRSTRVRIAYLQITAVTDVMRCSRSVLSERIRIPYLHVCESGFNAKISRWYSLSHLTDPTLEDCGREKNAAAWRAGRSGRAGCFVFYWNSNTRNVPDRHLPGQCYILDKVVPLGSLHPPSRIVTKLDLQHILFKG